MSLKVTKMDVWSGEIQDQPGGLAGVLRQLAGAKIETLGRSNFRKIRQLCFR